MNALNQIEGIVKKRLSTEALKNWKRVLKVWNYFYKQAVWECNADLQIMPRSRI